MGDRRAIEHLRAEFAEVTIFVVAFIDTRLKLANENGRRTMKRKVAWRVDMGSTWGTGTRDPRPGSG